MEDKAPYYSTLAYDANHSDSLKKLCRKLGIKQKEFIPLAVDYFKKTGIDPQDPPDQITNDLQQITKRSENRLIGFIKTQDKTTAKEFSEIKDHVQNLNGNIERLIKIIS